MQLGKIPCPSGSRKKSKRLGQGQGSGTGKTSGKGHKGQRSRSGAKRGRRTGFEGGQNPMHRRLPKIGFSNEPFRVTYQVVNVGAVEERGLEGEVGPEELLKAGLIRKLSAPVKILGGGDLSRAITIRANRFSKSAREKLAVVNGAAEVI